MLASLEVRVPSSMNFSEHSAVRSGSRSLMVIKSLIMPMRGRLLPREFGTEQNKDST